MNLDLSNKTALICGSTQGIGKAAAFELAQLGARVVLMARTKDKLKLVADEIALKFEYTPDFIVADFSNPDQVQANVKEYVALKGGFHILVNNTGGPPSGQITDAQTQNFIDAFNAHLICNHLLAQTCLPFMKKSGFGRIINVISTSVKQPIKGLGVSNTIRAAVGNWSKTLSLEVATYGITVNNVLPGATLTSRLEQIIQEKSKKSQQSMDKVMEEMTSEIPAKRFGQATEIAAAIAFLASPAAAYINGTNLVVDGGRTACL